MNNFSFYTNYTNVINSLPVELQGEFALAIIRYGCNQIEPEFSNPLLNSVFISIKLSLDKSINKATNHKGDKDVGSQPEEKRTKQKQIKSNKNKNKQTGINKQIIKYSNNKNINEEKFLSECNEILEHFNAVRGSRKKSIDDFAVNLHYWLYESSAKYSLQDIKDAISCIKFDKYWHENKISLEVFLRRFNSKNDNAPVDRIGDFLKFQKKLESEQRDLSSVVIQQPLVRSQAEREQTLAALQAVKGGQHG